jgi:hypothetical protein
MSEASEERIVKLRRALVECANHAGAAISDQATDEFLMLVPGEVKARISKLEGTMNALVDSILRVALSKL